VYLFFNQLLPVSGATGKSWLKSGEYLESFTIGNGKLFGFASTQVKFEAEKDLLLKWIYGLRCILFFDLLAIPIVLDLNAGSGTAEKTVLPPV